MNVDKCVFCGVVAGGLESSLARLARANAERRPVSALLRDAVTTYLRAG